MLTVNHPSYQSTQSLPLPHHLNLLLMAIPPFLPLHQKEKSQALLQMHFILSGDFSVARGEIEPILITSIHLWLVKMNQSLLISLLYISIFIFLATEITSPTNKHKPQRLTFLTTQIARTMAALKAFVHHQSITELVMDAALILICSIATIHITLRSIPSIHIPFCNKRNTHIPGNLCLFYALTI